MKNNYASYDKIITKIVKIITLGDFLNFCLF